MGFVSRKDIIGTTPGIIHYFRGEKLPFKKWLRSFDPGVDLQFYHQASTGKLIERQLYFYPFYLNLQNAGYFGYGITSVFQYLTETFSPLGIAIAPDEYRYLQHKVITSTDPSKKFNATANVNWGSYFNGSLTSGDFKAYFAPVPHISIGAQFNRNHFKKVGIERMTKTIDLYSIEGRFAVNPKLQLISFFQKNSDNNLYNLNVRFSWEYQPLSYIYIVFNRHHFDNQPQYNQTEDQLIGKISFLNQF